MRTVKTIRLRQGLTLTLTGNPEQMIHAGPTIETVAWQPPPNAILQPDKLVSEGQAVMRGEPLFIDRHVPEIKHVAPASGTVLRVFRSANQTLAAIEIRCSNAASLEFTCSEKPFNESSIRQLLQASGLWNQIRERPFNVTPATDAQPVAIFITAIDTLPLAPEPSVIINERAEEFALGVDALLTQTSGDVFVCQAGEGKIAIEADARVKSVSFTGPHPAGLAGVHMQRLCPADREHRVWQLDCQDVIAIGALLRSGVLSGERVIALAGNRVQQPRLLRTQTGASITELTDKQLKTSVAGTMPVVGSVFAGRCSKWLGCFDRQVIALDRSATQAHTRHSDPLIEREMRPPAVSRGFVAEPRFERISSLSNPTVPLLRALVTEDLDAAEALGSLELAAEDLELHAYICPVGNDYPAALTRCHQLMQGQSE